MTVGGFPLVSISNLCSGRSRLIGVIGAIAIASGVMAQNVTNFTPTTGKSFRSSGTISTYDFAPQINMFRRQRAVRPENPGPNRIVSSGPPNGLVAGSGIAPTASAPQSNFPGIGENGSIPADCDIAVGPTDVIQVVNTEIAFYNKATGQKTLQQSLNAFMKQPDTAFIFDPKVLFDTISRRFYVVSLDTDDANSKSFFEIAVSDDETAAGSWTIFKIEDGLNVGGTATWLDYPGFGCNKDLVVVSGNMFGFQTGFFGVSVLAMKKSELMGGGTVTPTLFKDDNSFTIQWSEVPDDTHPIYGIANPFAPDKNKVYALGMSAGVITMQSSDLPIPAFSPAPDSVPSTSSGGIDANFNDRLFQAKWRINHLVAAHTVSVAGKAACRWYDVNTNEFGLTPGRTPLLTQSGDIKGPGSVHFHMPAVGINKRGDISLIFSASGPTIVADVMIASRKAGDVLGSMGAPQKVRSSIADPFREGARWGDYFDVCTDPDNDLDFWGDAMISAQNGVWGTEITKWVLSVPVSFLASSASMKIGKSSVGTVDDLKTEAGSRSFNINSDLIKNVGQAGMVEVGFNVGAANVSQLRDLTIKNISSGPKLGTTFMYLKNWSTGKFDLLRSFVTKTNFTVTDKFTMTPAQFKPYLNSSGALVAQFKCQVPARLSTSAFVFKTHFVGLEGSK